MVPRYLTMSRDFWEYVFFGVIGPILVGLATLAAVLAIVKWLGPGCP